MDRLQFQAAMKLSAAPTDKWYEPCEQAMIQYAIVSPNRAAMFLATIGHESGDFRWLRELWGPTPAQVRYEGRADLGNTQRGDGKRFMGRGCIQITGRHNYQAVAAGLGVDCVNHPELLEQPKYAVLSAAWWWKNNGCNEIADTGDFRALTRRVNGGYNGMEDRQRRYEQAIQHLG